MQLGAAMLLGFGLGLKHAIEGDHLAAVCTFVTRDSSVAGAAKVGALWGLGHAAVIVLAGGALVATGASVPAPLAFALDVAVALMLVGLGVAAILGARSAHTHPHDHKPHDHRRPLAIGLVHGASGTAALTLLVASTISARLHALAFVVLFGLASIAAMSLMAALVSLPLRSAAMRAPRVQRALRSAAGAASIAAGVAVAWSVIV